MSPPLSVAHAVRLRLDLCCCEIAFVLLPAFPRAGADLAVLKILLSSTLALAVRAAYLCAFCRRLKFRSTYYASASMCYLLVRICGTLPGAEFGVSTIELFLCQLLAAVLAKFRFHPALILSFHRRSSPRIQGSSYILFPSPARCSFLHPDWLLNKT